MDEESVTQPENSTSTSVVQGIVSRRRLLGWMAGATAALPLAALLAACGGSNATPTAGTGGAGQTPTSPATQTTAPATTATGTATQAASPTQAATPTQAAGGQVVVALTAPFQSFDPANYRDRNTETLIRAMFDGLVNRAPSGDIVPEIAESWSKKSDTEWTFKLRSDVTFQNGDKLTADDVVFTLERVALPDKMDGKTSPRQSLLPAITAVTADDASTVTITLKDSVPEAILLAGLVHNQIVPKSYVEEVGGAGLAEKPVGAGAFKFVEGTLAERVILDRFDDYYGGSPLMPPVGPAKLDRVVFRIMPELSARLAALKSGEVQIIQGLNPDSAKQLKGDPSIVVKSYDGTRTTWLAMNCTSAPFDKALVRQAMNYGLDVDSIIDAVFGGEAVRMTGAVPPFSQYYDKSLKPYPYDPDKAKALLEQAGVPLNFQFVLDAQEADRSVAEIIVQQYRELGIDASTRIWEWPVLQKAALAGERQVLLGSWGNAFRHPVDLLNPTLMTKARGNYAQYSNPAIDDDLTAGAIASDAKAAEIYTKVQQILYDDAPWVFLWVPNEIEAGSTALVDWNPGPDGRELLADTSLND